MIQGQFGERGELFFPIDLITGEGEYLPVDAMLDTGFTEYLAINKQDIEELAWPYFDQEELLTAQGLANFDIYRGKIVISEQELEIPVFAGDALEEVLLGSKWLKLFNLIAKYREGVLKLE
ncbi:hypothetical protein [Gloeothece verrucosa]|uniref:Aspartyl protease n=1 Tax=Gloeothece verrucosa (strain PCC 7822) TaxID=497965 RepID=E0UNK3_GLOV7|nr:hypothetical protein [Gloeothece verrucosa]ADN18533.1 conserved hypothetical protein [Gloeothece verrucosa PCC 7822]